MKNKHNIKRRLAGALATCMVSTMLSPAMPVMASDTQADIKFDLGIYKTYESLPATVDDTFTLAVPSGTAVYKVTDPYPVSVQYPGDTGANGQSSSSINAANLEMPWWDADWSGEAAPAASWNNYAYNFPGYLLEGWYAKPYSEDPTQQKVNKIPTYFPQQGTPKTYYAHYKADDSVRNFTVKHNPVSGGIANIDITETEALPVLTAIQARPKVVPGYKADFSLTVAGALQDDAEFNTFVSKYDFEKDDTAKVLTGEMINKPITVDYTYSPDPSVSFNIIVNHDIYGPDPANPSALILKSTMVERHNRQAEELIESLANPIEAKRDWLGMDASGNYVPVEDRRYIMADSLGDTVEIETCSADNTRYLTGFPALDSTGSPVNPIGAGDTQPVIGKMPNQTLVIHYKYMPNPDYRLSMRVTYEGPNYGTSVADLVAAKLNAAGVDYNGDGTNDTFATAGDVITLPVGENSVGNKLFVPDLSAEGYATNVSAVVTDGTAYATLGSLDTSGAVSYFPIDITTRVAEIKITYVDDPAQWETILFNRTGNGVLKNTDGSIYSNTQANPVKVRKDAAGNATLDPSVLPIPEAEVGYTFDGWYYNGTRVDTTTPLALTSTSYNLEARFVRSSAWLNYRFEFSGLHGTMSPSSLDSQVLPLDSTGAGIPITWGDLTSNPIYNGVVPTVVPETGYAVRWYDSNGILLDATTDMTAYNNTTFTAYCVSTGGPVTLTAPTAEGVIDATTGEAQIQVDNIHENPDVRYAVTDENNIIIAVVTSWELQGAAGTISGNGLAPNSNYTIYQVDPTVGSTLSADDDITVVTAAGDISAPTSVQIPVCSEPVVAEDPTDSARAQITINPATPGYEYGLVDENGTVIKGWTSPDSNNQVIFDGLDQDKNYEIVVQPQGGSATPDAMTPGKTVNTTIGVVLGEGYPVVIVNQADLLSSDPVDLTEVPSGTTVTLQAEPLNSAGDSFERWRTVLGDSSIAQSALGNTYRFRMPNGTVVMQAVYSNGTTTWDPSNEVEYDNTINDGKDIGVEIPEDITDASEYRILVTKSAVTSGVKTLIEAEENAEYTGLFDVSVQVQKKNSAGIWQDDTTYANAINTIIETGRLNINRQYSLYKIATASSATASSAEKVTGQFESEWETDNYPGNFSADLENGVHYVFGYIQAPSFTVRVRDNITNTLQTTLYVPDGEALIDQESNYAGYITSCMPSPNPANNGLTWSYLGLSEDRNSFVEFRDNDTVTADMTLYLYYENDRSDRNQAVSDLNDAITEAKDMVKGNLSTADKTELENMINQAQAVLDQTVPREATTPELEAILDQLQDVIDRIKGNQSGDDDGDDDDNNDNNDDNNGGNNGGGSGGGGGNKTVSSGTKGVNGYRTYVVGQDGNWNLLNAEKHTWEFVLTNGSKLVDTWANLRYNYNGRTETYTYHFDEDGNMSSGWFYDAATGNWYFLSTVHDGFFGRLVTGWHLSSEDGRWYYLNSLDGHMMTGWQVIGGNWYYFATYNNGPTYTYDNVNKQWHFTNSTDRPYGSMFTNEQTPDGYHVGVNGDWIQ